MDASGLLIEKRHADMMTYARGALDQMPKRERVLADMIRTHMYAAWDLIGQQQWERDRRATLTNLDEELRRLKRLVRLAVNQKIISIKAYEIWTAKLVEEGKMVGGMAQKAAAAYERRQKDTQSK